MYVIIVTDVRTAANVAVYGPYQTLAKAVDVEDEIVAQYYDTTVKYSTDIVALKKI